MKLLQEQNVYTNLFLANLRKHGALFEIRETVWCLDSPSSPDISGEYVSKGEDLEFPKNKYIANAMLKIPHL